jgi:predicted ATPase/DNA-binding SARP family transcriptional activator
LSEQTAVPAVRICLLGGFSVEQAGKPVPEKHWRLRKVRNLVKLLALAPAHQMHREQLIELLWPDLTFKGALNMFYQTLHQVRRALESDSAPGQELLLYQNEMVSLAAGQAVVDVETFRAQAEQARRLQDISAYRQALSSYTGDLLPEDLYEEWAQPQRDALREEHVALWEAYAVLLEERGDTDAPSAWQKVVELDRTHEQAHARLMQLYAGTGQRQLALRQYQALKDALDQELDMEPAPETTQLYDDIQAGRVESSGSPSDKVMAAPRHNLPAPITSFIGRKREKSEVTGLLGQNRLVTLTGAGGTGKTRLALQVAWGLVDAYPQGVWFVELAGIGDADLLPRAIAAALGYQESPGRSLLAQLQGYLGGKRVLLVLDNCEHLIGACAAAAAALLHACPNLVLLASSREALNVGGEVAYAVPSLEHPDLRHLPELDTLGEYPAVRLFVERAGSAQPGYALNADNAQHIAQICSRLDGIPLAIELAAARISVLSTEQIAARLDNRFRLLTGGSRTALPRQQTLRASIDWSYSLLDEAERLLLQRLSVFYGGWSLEQAVDVCGFGGLDEFAVIDGLAQLAGKSLLLVKKSGGRARYRMLETIREYAGEKLFESNESSQMRTRHLDAFTRLAGAAQPHLRGPDQVEWLDQLEVEMDNLRAALGWALEGQPQSGLRLVVNLYWLWHIRGYRVEAEQWLQQLRDAIQADELDFDERALLAQSLARQVQLRVASGLYSIELAEQALSEAQSLGSSGKYEQALALEAMAWNASFYGNQAREYELDLQGLELAEELDDKFMMAEFLHLLSSSIPDRSEGMRYAEHHLELRRELGDLDGLITANMFLASHAYAAGDLPRARPLMEEAFSISRRVNNHWGMMITRFNLGLMLAESGDHDEGSEHLLQALCFAEELGEPIWTIWSLNAIGHAAELRGDWETARLYFQRGVEQSRANEDTVQEITSLINLAEAAWSRNMEDLARSRYAEVLERGQDLQMPFYQSLLDYARGKLALMAGDEWTARAEILQALQGFNAGGNLQEVHTCLEALTWLHIDQPEQAVRLYGVVSLDRYSYIGWGNMNYLASYDLENRLEAARTALGEETYQRLLEEGRAISIQQAAEQVLSGDFFRVEVRR